MGGLVSKAFKGAKKVVKGVGGIFKKTVKRVKKLGSKIWKSAKNLLGKVGNVFGKLGPLGTIAMSMMLPGLGTAISAAWGNAAGWLTSQASTVFQAVGKGMQYISNTAGYMKQGFSKMTDSISRTLSNVGGDAVSGFDKMVKGAQEYMGIKDPSGIKDAGRWIAEKAQSISGQPTTPQSGTPLLQEGPMKAPFQGESLFPGLEPAPAPQPGTFPLQSSVEAQASAQSAFETSNLKEMFPTQAGQRATEVSSSAARTDTKKDLAKEAAKALGSSLLGTPTQGTPFQPFQPVTAANVATGRGGIGGTGAGGGQFLSQQQLAAIQAFNKNLEEIG